MLVLPGTASVPAPSDAADATWVHMEVASYQQGKLVRLLALVDRLVESGIATLLWVTYKTPPMAWISDLLHEAKVSILLEGAEEDGQK